MAVEMTFTKLFTPVRLGPLTLKNRIAMAPMGTKFAVKNGLVTEQMKDYYEARARGGAGLVIVESTDVDYYRCTDTANRLALDNDRVLPGLSALARAIKKHGARAVIQLNKHEADETLTGFQPIAPSALPSRHGVMPRELRIDEMPEMAQLFVEAATRARRAGFEGVEIHAGHSHFLSTFISPITNKRHDRYGGSLENRVRLLIEVLQGIRQALGNNFALWCRINGQEHKEGGLTLEDAKAIAMMVNSYVDAIHISIGRGNNSLVTFPDTPGALLPLAAAVKQVVTVPVIAVGKLTLPVAEQALRDGKADVVAIGRALIADPDIPNKVMAGRSEDIIPCITCFHCHDVSHVPNGAIACAINTTVGKEGKPQPKPARKIKKIAVVGSGPAGMEAARVLASRGHKVILFEKDGYFGGQLRLAIVPPYKRERIEPFIDYLVTQIKKLNVEIRLNTAADLKTIEDLQPDEVILATGAIPTFPQLPGAALNKVVLAHDILACKVQAGRKVVVVGGGSTGCETAEYLLENGKDVTLIRFRPGVAELASDLGFRDRLRFMNRLQTLPMNLLADTSFGKIQKGGVTAITKDNKERFIEADTVVLAAGSKPNHDLFMPIRNKGFETHLAGDAWHIGKIADAVGDGFRLGSIL